MVPVCLVTISSGKFGACELFTVLVIDYKLQRDGASR